MSATVAYLTGRYPGISHTFIHREIEALEQRGVEVLRISVWRTAAAELLSPEDRSEAERTVSLLPLRPLSALRAIVEAARAPGPTVGLLRRALALGGPGPRRRAIALSWCFEALLVRRTCRRAGATHIHAHLNGTAPTVALLTAAFGRDRGEPWTWSCTVHGPSEFFDVYAERLTEKVEEATFVVAISDFARSQLMGLVGHEHWPKIEVVHCGVDPTVFRPARPAPDPRVRVLQVARLSPVKGQAVLLEALRLLREDGVDAEVTFVGDGPTREGLESLARELGVDDRATFAGAVGQDAIRGFYERADVFCLPSFAEGVPVVLMEAMAMEIPVIASRIAGVGELVEDGVSGLLTRPGRADEVAAALRRLAGEPQLRETMGAAGRAKVVEDFSVASSAARLEGLFRVERGVTGEDGRLVAPLPAAPAQHRAPREDPD